MKQMFARIKEAVMRMAGRLSFRTGVVILALCIPFYILSFAQMALDISLQFKGVLWVVFFGLAKTTQYLGLAVIGVEGWKRVKRWLRRDLQAD